MTPPPRSSRLSRVTPPTGWGAWLQPGVCCPTAQWGRRIFPGTAQYRLQQPAGAFWTGRCPPPPRTPGRLTTVLATPSTPLLHAWPFVWAGWTSYGSCWPSACLCPHAVSQIRILFHPSAGSSLTPGLLLLLCLLQLCFWRCAAWGGGRSHRARRTTWATGTTPSPWTISAGTPWSCPDRYTPWRARLSRCFSISRCSRHYLLSVSCIKSMEMSIVPDINH